MLKGFDRNPLDKAYHVYRRRNGFVTIVGNVMAANATLADTKAVRLFGRDVWTKEKQRDAA